MEKNKNRWLVVAIVAAVVAALTTVIVLVLRARAKKKANCEQDAFDCDLGDCACFTFEEEIDEDLVTAE